MKSFFSLVPHSQVQSQPSHGSGEGQDSVTQWVRPSSPSAPASFPLPTLVLLLCILSPGREVGQPSQGHPASVAEPQQDPGLLTPALSLLQPESPPPSGHSCVRAFPGYSQLPHPAPPAGAQAGASVRSPFRPNSSVLAFPGERNTVKYTTFWATFLCSVTSLEPQAGGPQLGALHR